MRDAAKKLVEMLINIIDGSPKDEITKIFKARMAIRQSTNMI